MCSNLQVYSLYIVFRFSSAFILTISSPPSGPQAANSRSPVLPFAIPSLCGKYLVTLTDDCCNDFNMFHRCKDSEKRMKYKISYSIFFVLPRIANCDRWFYDSTNFRGKVSKIRILNFQIFI